MSNKTGTYTFDKENGKMVKVSDRIPSLKKIPDWKRNMNPEEETRRGYASLEKQGKLNEVDDKEIWSQYAKR